jgi:hypothetical protein
MEIKYCLGGSVYGGAVYSTRPGVSGTVRLKVDSIHASTTAMMMMMIWGLSDALGDFKYHKRYDSITYVVLGTASLASVKS